MPSMPSVATSVVRGHRHTFHTSPSSPSLRRRRAGVTDLVSSDDVRVLGWALQADSVDEAELLRRVNAPAHSAAAAASAIAASAFAAAAAAGDSAPSVATPSGSASAAAATHSARESSSDSSTPSVREGKAGEGPPRAAGVAESDEEITERLRRAVSALIGQQQQTIGNGGLITSADLQSIKSRLYQTPAPPPKRWPARGFSKGEVQAESMLADALRERESGNDFRPGAATQYLDSAQATAMILQKAREFLDHRRGYILCTLHLVFMLLLIAILAIHIPTEPMFFARKAVQTAMLPADMYGDDAWSVPELTLESVNGISTWFAAVFFNNETGVWSDAVCGNGVCERPIEYAAWRAEAHRQGCALDCGEWAPSAAQTNADIIDDVARSVAITLTVDPRLPADVIAKMRWNLFCPEVVFFAEDLAYFSEDQSLAVGTQDSSAGADDAVTVSLFDCNWELRVYAPLGGLSGRVVHTSDPGSVYVQSSAIYDNASNYFNRGGISTFSFRGCAISTAGQDIGTLRLCEVDWRARGFNRTTLAASGGIGSPASMLDDFALDLFFDHLISIGVASNSTIALGRSAAWALASGFESYAGVPVTPSDQPPSCLRVRLRAIGPSLIARDWVRTMFEVLRNDTNLTRSGFSSQDISNALPLAALPDVDLRIVATSLQLPDLWAELHTSSATSTGAELATTTTAGDPMIVFGEIDTQADALRSSAWPLSTLTCDPSKLCTRALRLNDVCDSVCAVKSCAYDGGACCEPQANLASISTPFLIARPSDAPAFLSLRVDTGSADLPYAARMSANATTVRYLGDSVYRVVGGVLVEQKRHHLEQCVVSSIPNHITEALDDEDVTATTCLSDDIITSPLGRDAVFQPVSQLFDPDVSVEMCYPELPAGQSPPAFPFMRFPADTSSTMVDRRSAINRIRTEAAQDGFFDVEAAADAGEEIDGSYLVYFDNSFDYETANRLFTSMVDGMFFDDADDSRLEEVRVTFLVYCQELKQLLSVGVFFERDPYGSVTMHRRMHVFPPGYYESLGLGLMSGVITLEVLYVAGVVLSLVLAIRTAVVVGRTARHPLAYFRSPWHFLDLGVIICQLLQIIYWVEQFLCLGDGAFDPRLKYSIYLTDPACPTANLFQFNTTELLELKLLFLEADHLDDVSYTFYALNIVVQGGMALQFLNLLHFQPRLSLISRTFVVASGDLLHWALLFVGIEMFLALCLNLVCGSVIESISTFESTVQTLLLCLFGETSLAYDLGIHFPVVGYLFYYVHMIASFFVLLNMLLAIIVDAYIEVKRSASLADNLFADMAKHAKAGMRAARRPPGILSVAQVVERMAHWVKPSPPTPNDPQAAKIPLRPGFAASANDMYRVLQAFLVQEESRKQYSRVMHDEHEKNGASTVDFAEVDRQVEEITRSLMFHYAEGGEVKLTARTIAPSTHTLQSFSAANTTRRGSKVALSRVPELGGDPNIPRRADQSAATKVSSVGIEMTSIKGKNQSGNGSNDPEERPAADGTTVFV